MDWVKEYEEETGFSAYEFGGIPKRGYVEWLEEELDLKAKAGQPERMIKELEEIADSDCICSRHVFCDGCDASRGLNEIKQEIRKLNERLCT